MKSWMLPIVAVGAVLCAGCGRNVGWVIKPAPTDESLRETVIASDPGWFVGDKIAILDVDGLLFNKRGEGLLSTGENPVSLFVEKVDKAQADPNVKAVIVRINSPGGGVTASDIMHHRLKELRRVRKVPVIAVIQDVGASGAYYVACAADTIIAHPTSVTGSIGTLVQTISVAGTMKLLRMEAKAVTSGPRKDMASPFKPLDPEDLKILQAMVDEYYEGFLRVVQAGRANLDAAKVRALADGRVFTGRQALANGLVDRLGYMSDAVALAKKKSASPRVKLVMYHRPLGYRANAYSAAPPAPARPQLNLINVTAPEIFAAYPRFLYLWTGHSNR